MNNITQVKRGSTASWSLGPELVHWEDLDVWGKDSLIRCEGTDLEMNVYTASANYFYDENGQLEDFKRPGLWLIKKGEISWDISDQVIFKCYVEGPSDCWLEVYSSNIPTVHGQKIPLNAGAVEMTVPYLGEWGICMRWPEQRETVETARVKMSIRVKDAYEELAPGQLGVEYTDDGKTKLKIGMPNTSKWNELPYIGNENTIDWDIADESNPAAIKNKPFGMVEQMVDIIPERAYYFSAIGSQGQIGNVGWNFPFQDNRMYQVWLNGEYIGTAKPGELINIPNGTFQFLEGGFVIEGGNHPEGNYLVRVVGSQIITKKLDSQWLNTQNDIYVGDDNDPVSCKGVQSIVNNFANAISNLTGRLENIIIPAIGPVPTDDDNGKLLQIIDGKPTWVAITNGNEVAY